MDSIRNRQYVHDGNVHTCHECCYNERDQSGSQRTAFRMPRHSLIPRHAFHQPFHNMHSFHNQGVIALDQSYYPLPQHSLHQPTIPRHSIIPQHSFHQSLLPSIIPSIINHSFHQSFLPSSIIPAIKSFHNIRSITSQHPFHQPTIP